MIGGDPFLNEMPVLLVERVIIYLNVVNTFFKTDQILACEF